jgi:hypothetical protein
MTLPAKTQFAVNKPSHFIVVANTRSRFLFVVLALLCGTLNILTPALAQKQSPDFIATDSSLTTGKVSSLGNGKFEFRHHRKSPPILFGPNDVREYGQGDYVYESLEIRGERIFYKRLASGPATLYKNKKSYLFKFNDSLTHLDKQNYRAVFERTVVCEGGPELISTVAFNSASMANFLNRVNRGKCNQGNLPYRKFGLYAGYNLIQVNVDFNQTTSFNDGANAITIGLFFDYPVYKPRSLYVTGELLVTSWQVSNYEEKGNQTKYVGLDITAFVVPLGVKWVFPDGNVKPYVKAGGAFSYLKFNSPPEYFTTTSSNGLVELNQNDIDATKSIQAGFDAAAGLELPLGKRKNIHIECKYLNSFDVSEKTFQINCSGLFLNAGINF